MASALTSNNATLTSEVLSQLREDARLFIKLDLAYLVAAGAIVTALKVNRYEMIELVAEIRQLGFIYIALLGYDAIVNLILSREWVAAKLESGKHAPKALVLGSHNLQPLLHFLFIATLVISGVGFASGYSDARSSIKSRVLIEDEVEAFVALEKRIPDSFDEVKAARPRIQKLIEQLQNEPIKYEKVGKDSYRLIFAGPDRKLGTADDDVSRPELRLRRVWDSMERDDRASPSITK